MNFAFSVTFIYIISKIPAGLQIHGSIISQESLDVLTQIIEELNLEQFPWEKFEVHTPNSLSISPELYEKIKSELVDERTRVSLSEQDLYTASASGFTDPVLKRHWWSRRMKNSQIEAEPVQQRAKITITEKKITKPSVKTRVFSLLGIKQQKKNGITDSDFILIKECLSIIQKDHPLPWKDLNAEGFLCNMQPETLNHLLDSLKEEIQIQQKLLGYGQYATPGYQGPITTRDDIDGPGGLQDDLNWA